MAMSRECDAFALDYSALLDGELDLERATQLRAHIEGCADCQAELAALQRVDPLLRAASAPAVPSDLRARVQARIASENPPSVGGAPSAPRIGLRDRQARIPTPERARRRNFGIRPAVVIGAVAAAAAAVALILFQSGTGDERELPSVQVAEDSSRHIPTERIEAPEQPVVVAETRLGAPQGPTTAERRSPQAAPSGDAIEDLMNLESPDDLEVVEIALELDTLEDLDVIANLELLERLIALEEGTG